MKALATLPKCGDSSAKSLAFLQGTDREWSSDCAVHRGRGFLAYQVGVSAFVYSDRELTQSQRLMQLLLIWLLPLAGAAIAHFAYRMRRANEPLPERRFVAEREDSESCARSPSNDLT